MRYMILFGICINYISSDGQGSRDNSLMFFSPRFGIRCNDSKYYFPINQNTETGSLDTIIRLGLSCIYGGAAPEEYGDPRKWMMFTRDYLYLGTLEEECRLPRGSEIVLVKCEIALLGGDHRKVMSLGSIC